MTGIDDQHRRPPSAAFFGIFCGQNLRGFLIFLRKWPHFLRHEKPGHGRGWPCDWALFRPGVARAWVAAGRQPFRTRPPASWFAPGPGASPSSPQRPLLPWGSRVVRLGGVDSTKGAPRARDTERPRRSHDLAALCDVRHAGSCSPGAHFAALETPHGRAARRLHGRRHRIARHG